MLNETVVRSKLDDFGKGRGLRGDHDLNPDIALPARLRPAAVLIGLQPAADGPVIVMTRRAAHLTAHAGQISFPGGRCDVTDRDHVATALRESEEEIGLEPSAVSPLGRLDTYVTRTGFEIVPIVGWLSSAFVPRITSEEVAEIFTIPIDLILDDNNPQRHSRQFEGRDRYYYAYPHREWYIWGATAGMLVNLRDALTAGAQASDPGTLHAGSVGPGSVGPGSVGPDDSGGARPQRCRDSSQGDGR
ncbi:CoA pyrophosphatase [Fodinicurvata sp. EGI_FJ10296]|uniref:NUDIX hydrolase n=1 Tax=Fodinicurvata sp. EGI_FJ10296 TaxID=3231908 RepID=UPI003451BCB8